MHALQKAVRLFACLTVAIIGVSPPAEAEEQVTVKPSYGGLPVAGSIRKIAMLSCPRLDPYRNLPDGWTWMSAQ